MLRRSHTTSDAGCHAGCGSLLASLLVMGGACGSDPTPAISAAQDPEAANPYNCADIYLPDILPAFEVEIAPAEWQALIAEFQDWRTRQDQNLDLKPYHPAIFHYGDETIPDAFIELQGTPSTSWVGDKMQFAIAFDKVDPTHRFHGQKKIILHASPSEQTFLRERLALSYLRGLGLPAACENNARLTVNGAFYGLYANREAPERPFLDRVFPGSASGDLWKGGYELDNNQSSTDTDTDHARQVALMTSPTVDTFNTMVDVDEALLDWAAEAVMPDSDGYWALDHNFYLYDHPAAGFLWLPYDVDATFDFAPFDADPITWVPSWSKGWGVHQQLVMGDPTLSARYIAAVDQALGGYDVEVLKSRVLRWQKQIAHSVSDDHSKPFSTSDQELAVARMTGSFWLRSRFVTAWLACFRTGVGEDHDHDGFVWCHDCNDNDAAQNPAAAEMCGNDVDENCNGRKDDCAAGQ